MASGVVTSNINMIPDSSAQEAALLLQSRRQRKVAIHLHGSPVTLGSPQAVESPISVLTPPGEERRDAEEERNLQSTPRRDAKRQLSLLPVDDQATPRQLLVPLDEEAKRRLSLTALFQHAHAVAAMRKAKSPLAADPTPVGTQGMRCEAPSSCASTVGKAELRSSPSICSGSSSPPIGSGSRNTELNSLHDFAEPATARGRHSIECELLRGALSTEESLRLHHGQRGSDAVPRLKEVSCKGGQLR